MQYALLYFETPGELAKRSDPAAVEGYWAGWNAYMQMMGSAGIMRGGAGLQPPETRTLVRGDGAGRVVEDGPFAEAREELGGFVLIEVADLDAALAMAGHAPCAAPGAGHVEVRPVLPPAA